MNMKKMVSCLVAGSMLTMAVSAFAQIPETQVSTINNAAVVAFEMCIRDSLYMRQTEHLQKDNRCFQDIKIHF